MMAEGLRYMLVGMGVVFAFLGLLVVLVQGAGRVLSRFDAHDEGATATGANPPNHANKAGIARAPIDDDEAIAVVLAVAEAYRRGTTTED